MGKIYGYVRISTKKQNMERQIRNIQKEYPEAVIIKEVYTGTKFQGRKELNKLIKQLKAGDTVAAGQKLGTVGTVGCECAEESHIHVEVKQGENYLDPAKLPE